MALSIIGTTFSGKVIVGTSQVPQTYWVSSIKGPGAANDEGTGIAGDSLGNIYVSGYSVISGGTDAVLFKYNSAGTLLWQRAYGNLSTTDYGYSVAVDTSNNPYLIGATSFAGWGAFAAKYDPSGTLQWQRTVTIGSTSTSASRSGAVDSAGNAYSVGNSGTGTQGTSDGLFIKYSSTGTVLWKKLVGGSGHDTFWDVHVDSSDNIFIAGNTNSGYSGISLIKYNSSGTILWQSGINLTETGREPGIATDSAGNIYVATGTGSTGSNDMLLFKLDSDGAIIWQRRLAGTGIEYFNRVEVDSSGNIYASGKVNSQTSGNYDIVLVKYNPAGTLLWQRAIGTTGIDWFGALTLDSFGNPCVSAYVSVAGEANNIFVAKLPPDGSGTGTYGTVIYKTVAFTESTPTFAGATPTFTDPTPSYTDSDPDLGSVASTLTYTTTPIP